MSSKLTGSKNPGSDAGDFPETFSGYWKIIFSWVSTHEIYLEIVSGISPDRPFFGISFWDLLIWVNSFSEALPESSQEVLIVDDLMSLILGGKAAYFTAHVDQTEKHVMLHFCK